MKRRMTVCAAVVILAAGLAARCEAQALDLSARVARLAGDSTYAIGGHYSDNMGNEGDIWFPLSELEWPLDVWMAEFSATMRADRLSLSASVSGNLTDDAGEMKDSDWGVYYAETGDPYFSPRTKDVFSTSDATLDALVLDLKAGWDIYRAPTLSFWAGAGWLYQDFDYEAGNVHQYSPSVPYYGLPYDPFIYVDRGKGIEYRVTYSIPYLELGLRYSYSQRLRMDASIGYSPLVTVEDEDDHLLRSKLNRGDCEGSAAMVRIALDYDFSERWYAGISLDYAEIDTDGTQHQEFYAGEDAGYEADIDMEITGTQTLVGFEAGFRF